MYVMTARARSNLFLVWIGGEGNPPPVLELMPPPADVRIAG